MNQTELQHWLDARLPAELLAAPPEIRSYPDEVVIVLQPACPDPTAEHADTAPALLAQQREASRPLRMRLARELQGILGLPVSWGMRVGGHEALFTTRSSPVMTRLGRSEREVLDTLVAAGVADTRSSALAYMVRAFATEHADWLAEMRQALTQIDELRGRLTLSRRPGPPNLPDEPGG